MSEPNSGAECKPDPSPLTRAYSFLRSAWAWTLLAAILLPLFVLGPLLHAITRPLDPRRDHFRRAVARWVSLYGRFSPLYHFDLRGREHLESRAPSVIVANHDGGLDIIALFMLGTSARILTDEKFFRIPLGGWLLRASQHIPLRPKDPESRKRALETAEGAITAGTSVVIFPEGRISPDRIAPFRPGAFALAGRARVDVVPLLLDGTHAWRTGTAVVEGRHEIRVEVRPRIAASEIERTDPQVLADRVRADLIASHSRTQPRDESDSTD